MGRPAVARSSRETPGTTCRRREGTLSDPRSWIAHVDESGDFRKREAPVLVCAVLMDQRLADRQFVLTEVRLRNVARDLPRPLHAAHLNEPVLVALAHRMGGHPFVPGRQPSSEECHRCQLAERTVELLRAGTESDKKDLETALTALHDRRRPKVGLLKRLALSLRERDGDLLRSLRDVARGHLAQVDRELQRVAGADRSAERREFQIALIASTEATVGDAWPDEDAPPREDRYTKLLDALVRRTAGVAGAQDGVGVVRLRVQGRAIERGEPPFKEHLEIEDLQASIERVETDSPGDATVEPLAVDAYGETAPPWHVLADYAAFQGLRALCPVLEHGEVTSLRDLEQSLHRRIGLPVRSGPEGRSHVAVIGSSAATGMARDAAAATPSPWMAEQDRQWGRP